MAKFASPFCGESFVADADATPTPVHCPKCRELFEIADRAPPPPAPVIVEVQVPDLRHGGQSPFAAAAAPAPGFECPFCHSRQRPIRRSQVSIAGWVTLIALLLTCFPLFWIGLLLKEDVHVCQSCKIKLG